MNRQGYPWRFVAFIVLYYTTNSVYQGYISVYFREIGLGAAQIGLLMSSVPIASMVFQPLWGTVADRSKSRRAVLLAMALISAVFMAAFHFGQAFYYLLAVLCLFSAAFTAIQPLGDSIALEALARNRQPYGPLRMIGSISYAIGSLVFGWLLEGRIGILPFIVSGLILTMAASTFALPAMPGHQKKTDRVSMFEILKLPHMAGLLAFISVQQLAMGYFYSFYPIFFVALPGSGTGLLGWSYVISSLSEIPFLIFADRLYNRFGAGKLLCLSAAAISVRWALLALLRTPGAVMASQLLHGWGFIVMTFAMSKYLSDAVPPALHARGQMLLSFVTFGLARVASNLLGGCLAEAVGIQNGFFASLALSLGALIAFAPKYLRAPALNGSAR